MQSLSITKLKKLDPRQGYLAPYVQLPWGYGEELIGKDIEIFSTEDGFTIKFIDEKFKQTRLPDKERKSPNIEERLLNLEQKIEQITSILVNKESFNLCPTIPQNIEGKTQESTLLIPTESILVGNNVPRARGLVGYDVALTRRRSPVRIRPSPSSRINPIEFSSVSLRNPVSDPDNFSGLLLPFFLETNPLLFDSLTDPGLLLNRKRNSSDLIVPN